MNRLIRVAIGILLMGWLTVAGPPARADETAAQLKAVLDKVAPSVVTVRTLIKGGSGNSDSRLELQGVVVDRSGLVMIPNTPFSPRHLQGVLGQASGSEAPENAAPTDIKVVLDRDEREYDAFLAGTDTRLDLAFVKIRDLAGRTVTPIDFSVTGAPAVGDQLVVVSRLRRGYDYTPYLRTGRVGGVLEHPRLAWIFDGSVPGFGLPVFTPSGNAVGVLVTLEQAASDEAPDTVRFHSFLHSWGNVDGLVPSFILPSASVLPVIAQATRRAAELSANPPAPQDKGK